VRWDPLAGERSDARSLKDEEAAKYAEYFGIMVDRQREG